METHPVDVHVGKRLRSRRTILGRSQEEIGTAVGITFQQIQKYERGLNRIGSSRLYEFAKLLGVSVSYFFEDMEQGGKNVITTEDVYTQGVVFEDEGLGNKEVLALVRAYYSISSPQIRKKVLSLVKSLSDSKCSNYDQSTGCVINKERKLARAEVL